MFVKPELKTKEVEAFGQIVIVSEIGALDRIEYVEYQQALEEEGGSKLKAGVLLKAFMAAKCMVNEDGSKVYEGQTAQQVAAGIVDMQSLNAVFEAALHINGLAIEEQETEVGN